MPYADVNGIRMYYESHGDGPALVFAHGAGGNHLSWWQQVPYFRGRYRCIAFDHRGFGLSADIESSPGASAFPEDLRCLLDALQIDQAFLVAQSMGGGTCMGFTAAYPERVRALVMCDTIGAMSDDTLTEKNRVAREGRPLSNDEMSPLFLAAIEATEEAVYNSLFRATTVSGRTFTARALPLDSVLPRLRERQANR